MKSVQWAVKTALLVTFLLPLVGCGGSGGGPTRIPVSGMITVNGKPAPLGIVMMQPAGGASGVGATTGIVDGKYYFNASNGPQPGKYQLIVDLADSARSVAAKSPKPSNEVRGNPNGIALPGNKVQWTFEIEVPPEGEITDRNFDIK